MHSPFEGISVSKWNDVTKELLQDFPIAMSDLVGVVQASWEDIFLSHVGRREYCIGTDIFPEPQIMGFLLHELIPLNLSAKFPRQWRRGAASSEFDARYLPDDFYSFEIKTSSSQSGIFGNRSYAHVSNRSTKRRGGYLLAVNFEKFVPAGSKPALARIRFGWLDASDWLGQKAESGQQAHLSKEARSYKLRLLWPL